MSKVRELMDKFESSSSLLGVDKSDSMSLSEMVNDISSDYELKKSEVNTFLKAAFGNSKLYIGSIYDSGDEDEFEKIVSGSHKGTKKVSEKSFGSDAKFTHYKYKGTDIVVFTFDSPEDDEAHIISPELI